MLKRLTAITLTAAALTLGLATSANAQGPNDPKGDDWTGVITGFLATNPFTSPHTL